MRVRLIIANKPAWERFGMPRRTVPPERLYQPWTDLEDALLGTMSDTKVAAKINRTQKAVETRRRNKGIPPKFPHSRGLTKKEIGLLGTLPDEAVAKRLGVRRNFVIRKRKALGIAAFRGNGRR